MWSILAFIPGALFVNISTKAPLYSWLLFVLVRLIVLFTIKIREVSKVGVGIESKNLVLVSGLFSSRKVNIPLEYINNIAFNQGFLQKIFKVGNLVVVSREATTGTPSIDKETAEEIIRVVQDKK